jgi:hypothetical protein
LPVKKESNPFRRFFSAWEKRCSQGMTHTTPFSTVSPGPAVRSLSALTTGQLSLHQIAQLRAQPLEHARFGHPDGLS